MSGKQGGYDPYAFGQVKLGGDGGQAPPAAQPGPAAKPAASPDDILFANDAGPAPTGGFGGSPLDDTWRELAHEGGPSAPTAAAAAEFGDEILGAREANAKAAPAPAPAPVPTPTQPAAKPAAPRPKLVQGAAPVRTAKPGAAEAEGEAPVGGGPGLRRPTPPASPSPASIPARPKSAPLPLPVRPANGSLAVPATIAVLGVGAGAWLMLLDRQWVLGGLLILASLFAAAFAWTWSRR